MILYSVTGPCGHTTDIDLSGVSTDYYACCMCGLEWHVAHDPPIRHASGWTEPGNKRVVMGPPHKSRKQRRAA